MPSFSFKPALNTIDPVPGMMVAVYMSDVKLGSGIKPFLVIGASPRYVTLYYVPRLLPVRIKRRLWPTYHATVMRRDVVLITTELNTAIADYIGAAKRFDAACVRRAYTVLGRLTQKGLA